MSKVIKCYCGTATRTYLTLGYIVSQATREKHAPIISALKTGKLEFNIGSETKTLEKSGRFVECQNNKVIVLVEGAIS